MSLDWKGFIERLSGFGRYNTPAKKRRGRGYTKSPTKKMKKKNFKPMTRLASRRGLNKRKPRKRDR